MMIRSDTVYNTQSPIGNDDFRNSFHGKKHTLCVTYKTFVILCVYKELSLAELSNHL